MEEIVPKYYWKFNRNNWSKLEKISDLHLGKKDLNTISGLVDPIDMEEINSIYKPLCALLQIHYEAYLNSFYTQRDFLGLGTSSFAQKIPPFIIGIAGSVAVGKSSTARLLQKMLYSLPSRPKVDLVTTDGFLYPNSYLKANSLMDKKGFPVSYNMELLTDFLVNVKYGEGSIDIPEYSHVEYDILENKFQIVDSPEILIVEGLNVLQQVMGTRNQSLSDFFNFSIYIDANSDHIEDWYVERFLGLRETAFQLENSYFKHYANLSDDEAVDKAKTIWRTINLKNLEENIYHTRTRATAIIRKSSDHKVESIFLRKP